MKLRYLLLLWLFPCLGAYAQIELSNFTATGRAGISTTLATDYQAQGINPANLAFEPTYEGKHVTIGFGELGFSTYSDALSKINLRTAVFNPNHKLTSQEKYQTALDFANKGVTVNLDFLYGGYSWQKPSGGMGFCFTMRERAQLYTKLNPNTADILYNGWNSAYFRDSLLTEIDTTGGGFKVDTIGAIARAPKLLSDLLDGTRLSLAWFREYGFGYGVNILHNFDLKLDMGVGVKYIQGIGFLDIESKGANMTAFIAASPGFSFITLSKLPVSANTDTNNIGFLPNPAGHGVGFEVGFTAILKEKYIFSAAVNDIGSVTYQTNAYTASDTLLTNIATNGLDSYNFFRADQFEGFQEDVIKWRGLERRSYSLPTKLRLGAAITKEKYNAGLELVIPLNKVSGNFVKPFYSIGGEYKGISWLRVGSGLMFGGNYNKTFLVPLGVTFIIKNGLWEIGVASRDIITYMKGKNPILSVSSGFLRFRF